MADQKYEPVFARMQIGPGEGPEMYIPSNCDCFLKCYSRFLWHHTDLCRFHQMYYAQYVDNNDRITAFERKHTPLLSEMPPDDARAYMQSKLRESLFNQDDQLQSTRVFADQLFVIGLWATVEQFVGRALIEAERILGATIKKRPHKWSRICEGFYLLGIDIKQCKSYAIVDECRVLNNKIKHDGGVDEELSRFPAFADMLDTGLERIKLDLQRYADGVFEFVGHVLEAADAKCGQDGQNS